MQDTNQQLWHSTTSNSESNDPVLSTLARYELRKLFQGILSGGISSSPQYPLAANPQQINQLLRQPVPQLPDQQRVQQLETLLLMRHQISTQLNEHYNSNPYSPKRREPGYHILLTMLEQEIFQVLEVMLAQPPLRAKILLEAAVSCFAFAYEDSICRAIAHDGKYYGLVASLSAQQRLFAHQFDWLLRNLGMSTVLTISDSRYRLWIDLRAPSYRVLHKQGQQLLHRLQSFQAVLRTLKQDPLTHHPLQ
ncbi:MAG: hypothetical protein VKJ24_14130 [Synechococcales bacterium]|nr:hypothetical protein [Synechococcales bacterium]